MVEFRLHRDGEDGGKYTVLSFGTLYFHGPWKSSHYTSGESGARQPHRARESVLRKDTEYDFRLRPSVAPGRTPALNPEIPGPAASEVRRVGRGNNSRGAAERKLHNRFLELIAPAEVETQLPVDVLNLTQHGPPPLRVVFGCDPFTVQVR